MVDLDKKLNKLTQSFEYFQQQNDKMPDKITENIKENFSDLFQKYMAKT